MVGGGYLVILVFLELALMVDELEMNEQLVVEEEEGYLYPLLPPPQAAQSLPKFITIRANSRNTRITRSPPPPNQSS
jgi:hypothetical protein